jgi:hypothetical protein
MAVLRNACLLLGSARKMFEGEDPALILRDHPARTPMHHMCSQGKAHRQGLLSNGEPEPGTLLIAGADRRIVRRGEQWEGNSQL